MAQSPDTNRSPSSSSPAVPSVDSVKGNGRKTPISRALLAAAAAIIAGNALAACSGDDTDSRNSGENTDAGEGNSHDEGTLHDGGAPAPHDVCTDPERASELAPTPTIDAVPSTLNEQLLRVEFTIPEFDQQCQGPLTVSVMATMSINPSHVVNPPGGYVQDVNLGTRQFPGPIKTSVDLPLPIGHGGRFDALHSIYLVVTDANGKQSRSATYNLD